MPKVSVIIPCYNQGKYIEETVASVLAQSYDDFEIVIVNDGSSDEFTADLLRNFQRPKTRVIHTGNQGVSAARNTGIGAASGEYILPLDGDDLIGPHYLAQAVRVLDADPAIGIVSCLIEFFGDVNYRPQLEPFRPESLLVRNDLPCASLFRRSDWLKVDGFNENMVNGWEDWDFWLSLVESGVLVCRLPEVLFYYRIRQGSRERSMDLEKQVRMHVQVYRNHRQFYEAHIGEVFRELAECRLLLSSKGHRLAAMLNDPRSLVKRVAGKIGRMMSRNAGRFSVNGDRR